MNAGPTKAVPCVILEQARAVESHNALHLTSEQ